MPACCDYVSIHGYLTIGIFQLHKVLYFRSSFIIFVLELISICELIGQTYD